MNIIQKTYKGLFGCSSMFFRLFRWDVRYNGIIQLNLHWIMWKVTLTIWMTGTNWTSTNCKIYAILWRKI